MRERRVSPTLPVRLMKNTVHNPNRSLVRIFCLSLGGLLIVSAATEIYTLMMRPDVGAARWRPGNGW